MKNSHPRQEHVIFETRNFTVERHPQPFVSREEGGHLRIFPKDENVSCINDLTPSQASELIRLEMLVREAIIAAMNEQGIPVVWVNLEDLGNWAFKTNERPKLHIHVFGRAATATKQKWPEAPYLPDRTTGFYDDFVPLTDEDMAVINRTINQLLTEERYSDFEWKAN